MKKEWIEIMQQTKRLKLSRVQFVTHYFIVVFMLIIPAFAIPDLYEIYVTGTYDGVRTTSEIISFPLPWFVLAIAFYFIQKRRLKFREVNIDYSAQEFNEAIKRTAEEFEWIILVNSSRIFQAQRPWNWEGSWGEIITIIKEKDRLLLNSICDPDQMSSVVSMGWNKKNINTFLKNLADVKNGISAQVENKKPEREWTLKKTLFRLIAYPFCFFLIGFGVIQVFSSIDLKSLLYGIGAIAIASVYLYADLKLIFEKKK